MLITPNHAAFRSLTALAIASLALATSPAPAISQTAQIGEHVAASRAQKDPVDQYRTRIEFLADPKLEGRGPGTKGNETAAEYIERSVRLLGALPVFPGTSNEAADGMARSFRQVFTAGNNATQRSVELRGHVGAGEDTLGEITEGIRALGFSASAEVLAPLVFVGYSIEQGGPDKSYSSYPKDADKPLEGKIAVMLRFEPMGEDGRSLWRKKEDTLWSAAAALPDKIAAAIGRGAAGIILVSPPGCDDPRSKKLESAEATVRWMRTLDVPAVMLSSEAGEMLVKARDPQHRTLQQLRELADKEGSLVPLGAQSVRLAVTLDRTPRTTWNIAATIPGSGTLKDQYIIIGAHYDHVGYGYTGGSRSDEYGIVHPGADDNASGTAGLLLAADILKAQYAIQRVVSQVAIRPDPSTGNQPEADLRSIMLIAFSAEEMGLIGSREFLKACPMDAKQIDAMLNMDMIGRLRDNTLELSGTGTAEGFTDIIRPAVDESKLKIQASPGGRGPSDHATFYGAGIPVLHFYTGTHEQYHTPRDTVDLINIEGAVRVVNLVCDIALTLARREQPLAFVSTDKKKGESDEPGKPQMTLGGVRVRFGIAPGNYADGEAGILVGDVFPGTCAAEAGIQKDDRLIRWNGKEIGDVQSWMGMLGQHKPGDVVDLEIRRGKETLTVRATLKSRDQAPK